MTCVFVTQAELDGLLQRWRKDYPVYLPAAGRQDCASSDCGPGWRLLEGESSLTVSVGPALTSVKTFLFPQPETMLVCSRRQQDPAHDLLRHPLPESSLQVVVGVRPCDGHSVRLNNLPFAEDSCYQARLARTALVGFSCDEQLATCFCREVGGSPMGVEGLDIALTSHGNGYLLEILSDIGKKLMEGTAFVVAEAADLAALQHRRSEAGPQPVAAERLATLKECDLEALYHAPCWQPLGDACINCGACTFLCPTCYCFDIQDETVRGDVRRIRYWDSCMFPLYSLHTTGHNPRGQKVQRTRNRFLHKLKYFPERYGPFSCVGCGRCVHDCPVNIDIREVLRDMLTVQS